MHALIKDLMSSALDIRVMICFILLYHDPFILTSSSFPLISHFTISVLLFSFACHFTYATAFDFLCVLVFLMSLYGGWSHLSPISSCLWRLEPLFSFCRLESLSSFGVQSHYLHFGIMRHYFYFDIGRDILFHFGD